MSIALQSITEKFVYVCQWDRIFGQNRPRKLKIRANDINDAITIAWGIVGSRPNKTYRFKPALRWGDYLPILGDDDEQYG